MKARTARLFSIFLIFILCTCGGGGEGGNTSSNGDPLSSQSVSTWHYDNLRTAANPNESVLTLENVNPTSFGQLFVLPVDGAVIGQALYLGSVPVATKGKHNVVYVATMNDSVYAFDADSNTGPNADPLWQTTLLPAGEMPVPISVHGCQGVTGWTEVGVSSTPVIDTSTGTLYVVGKSYANGTSIFRLHALDVTSGEEKLGGPVEITANFTLNGHTDTFNALAETNRPGLLLANGHVYVGFGSNGCNDFGDQGWVLSYNASTLALEGSFNTEPGRALASIWQKGGGLSADNSSNIYAEAAEGSFNPGTNFGSTILKLTQFGANLQLADWFTPYNQAFLNANDQDLNTPVLVLPDQPGPHPHLAVGSGKQGTLYLLDRDNMGHYCSSCSAGDTQIVQEFPLALGKDPSGFVYWNSTVYSSGTGAPIMAWPLTNGMLPTTPAAESATAVGGHSPIITSNGTSNGILWQINGSALVAYNAQTLSELYSTAQTNGRDTLPPLPHFAQFMAVNGKVYVSTNSGLAVFGLL